jgi:hypothetical protein
MLVRLSVLRAMIREELLKVRDVLSPEKSDREQIGSLGKRTLDPECQEEDDIPAHLRDQDYDVNDYWGPVPPTAPEPYASADPNVNDWGILPTGTIKRG